MTAVFLIGTSTAALAQSGVYTFHNNYMRWGWNFQETILTPSTFTSATTKFGVIATVNSLDGQIYAQPLVAPGTAIRCPPNQTIVICSNGSTLVHDVIYVETTNNTIYAIDANSGAILLKRNFGHYGHCHGMVSTPVIDPTKGILYLVSDGFANGVYSDKLYALDIGTLTDVVAPYNITGADTSDPLTSGVKYGFNPATACQRPGLLLVGGNVYAAFGGFEYMVRNKAVSGPSRGWLLGWKASDLTPLLPLLTNQEASATSNFFLSSIWMSGAGVASDGTNLYFLTGNSDPSGKSYDPVKNIEESVVKVTANLAISSIFTPSDYAILDQYDNDLGSGGAMVLPANGNASPLVVAAGKDGRMFLLNSASLGGYTPGGPNKVLDTHDIGGCWCAPAFFEDQTGPHVVSSGGNTVMTWNVVGSATGTPQLVQAGQAQLPVGDEDPGFFTSVSSNGANSVVIWAVGRPVDSSNAITLYAFNGVPSGGTLLLLGSYPAGTWTAASNLTSVPVVANGKVYVVSGNSTTMAGTLTIFGILP